MKVLVTGHNGYIGSVLVKMLLEQGHDVEGLDTNYFVGCYFGKDEPSLPAQVQDVRDDKSIDLRNFDALIHLAGLSNENLF